MSDDSTPFDETLATDEPAKSAGGRRADDSLDRPPDSGDALDAQLQALLSADEGRASAALEGVVLAGKYRLESLLGEGGVGQVYRACHVETGGALAVQLSSGHPADRNRTTSRGAARSRDGATALAHVYTHALRPFGLEGCDGNPGREPARACARARARRPPGAAQYYMRSRLTGRKITPAWRTPATTSRNDSNTSKPIPTSSHRRPSAGSSSPPEVCPEPSTSSLSGRSSSAIGGRDRIDGDALAKLIAENPLYQSLDQGEAP